MGGSDPFSLAFCSGRGGRDINASECLSWREKNRNTIVCVLLLLNASTVSKRKLIGIRDMFRICHSNVCM